MGEKNVVNRHIYVARDFFLLFYDDFMMTITLNMSNWKYKLAYLKNIHQYTYTKISLGK